MNDGKSIPKRFLGASGIEVSAIGLGCMSLSGVYGTSNDDDGIALVHQALDAGITLLDTSDMYGFGHNEELVGQAIKGRRGWWCWRPNSAISAGAKARSPRAGRAMSSAPARRASSGSVSM